MMLGNNKRAISADPHSMQIIARIQGILYVISVKYTNFQHTYVWNYEKYIPAYF